MANFFLFHIFISEKYGWQDTSYFILIISQLNQFIPLTKLQKLLSSTIYQDIHLTLKIRKQVMLSIFDEKEKIYWTHCQCHVYETHAFRHNFTLIFDRDFWSSSSPNFVINFAWLLVRKTQPVIGSTFLRKRFNNYNSL